MHRLIGGRLTLDPTPDGCGVWTHVDAWGSAALSTPAATEAEALALLDELPPAYAELADEITAEDVAAMWTDIVDGAEG